MSDDMPTTAYVRQVFSNKPGSYYAKQQAIFDRWLLDHDAATRTAALEEAAVIAEQHSARSGHCSGCDMALVIAATIRTEKVAD